METRQNYLDTRVHIFMMKLSNPHSFIPSVVISNNKMSEVSKEYVYKLI